MTLVSNTYLFLRFLLVIGFLLGVLPLETEARRYMVRLNLSDKHGTRYSLQHPEAFLSQRALERRARQHLSLDSTDLPVSQVYLDGLAARGANVVSKSKWNNSVLVCGDSLPFLKSLGDLPYVLKTELVYIEPDSLKPFECPRRTKTFDELKGDDDATREQLEQIHLNALHKAGFRGKGILVAVLDGGFQYADHIPALKRINKVGERDFVFPPSHNIYREHSHGMKVLSVMAVHEKGIFEDLLPRPIIGSCDANRRKQRAVRKRTSGLRQQSSPIVLGWMSSIHRWAIQSTMMKNRTMAIVILTAIR